MKNLLLVFTAFALAGFMNAQNAGSATSGTPSQPATRYSFLNGWRLDLRALLPDPPLPGSSAQQADMAAVRLGESSRTVEDVRAAQRDDHEESIFAYATVLGPRFSAVNLPLTAAFSLRLREESAAVNPTLKTAFHRPRPFVANPSLHPVCDLTSTNSYPSGHAMVGYLEGFALAQMIPEKSDAILKRADDYARNRIVCGVHYPTDIAASHTAALALFGALSTSAAFQQQLQASREEIRKSLGMPTPAQESRP